MAQDDENILGMIAHLLGIFTGFIGPLVMFIVTSEKKGLAYENSKHALNFQISMIIYFAIAGILILVLIGILLMPILSIFGLIVAIIGTLRAYQGEVYSYPLEIKFLK